MKKKVCTEKLQGKKVEKNWGGGIFFTFFFSFLWAKI
jgi:hypothetical protein